jgi:hypothetical protein
MIHVLQRTLKSEQANAGGLSIVNLAVCRLEDIVIFSPDAHEANFDEREGNGSE